MASSSRYIHGTDPDEQRRLTTLNDLFKAACAREAALVGGERVLDVGAGLGQLTRILARAAGRAAVGIERSHEQIAEALRRARADGEDALLELRDDDALAFPLRDAEWAPSTSRTRASCSSTSPDPARVVAQMVRAVRPGGRVILCDDDHSLMRLHPEPPGFRAVWEAFVRSYDRNGNDPYVGRRLPALLAAAGAPPRRATWVFFGACAGDPSFPGFVANLAGNLAGARAAIAATGMVNESDVDRVVDALRGVFSDRRDSVIWYAMLWAEGVRAS